jgi:hypothetical protein
MKADEFEAEKAKMVAFLARRHRFPKEPIEFAYAEIYGEVLYENEEWKPSVFPKAPA